MTTKIAAIWLKETQEDVRTSAVSGDSIKILVRAQWQAFEKSNKLAVINNVKL